MRLFTVPQTKTVCSTVYIQSFDRRHQQVIMAERFRRLASHAKGRRFESRARHVFVFVLFLHFFFIKGNFLQNNNKKMCFLKTDSLLRIEVFYKRIEDYKR